MKNSLIGISWMVFWGAAPFVLAQTKVVTPRPSLVVHSEKGVSHSPTHAFNVQLRQKMGAIGKGVKAGKLTQSQGRVLMEKVKAIRVLELQMQKGNASKDLTQSQIGQLSQQLAGVE